MRQVEETRWRCVAWAAGVSVALLAGGFRTSPTELVVTTTADDPSAICLAGLTQCSLRGAILLANSLGGARQIVLKDGDYALTRSGSAEERSVSGDLDIFADITIRGISPSHTIIDGLARAGASAGTDRVFDVHQGGRLTLQHLTVQGGAPEGQSPGGGIRVDRGGWLDLRDVRVQSNRTFRPNEAKPGADGAGIYNLGTASLQQVVVEYNHSDGSGGGISNGGALRIQETAVRGNAASVQAAAIHNWGSVSLVDSEITGNVAGLHVGGILDESGRAELRNVWSATNASRAGAADRESSVRHDRHRAGLAHTGTARGSGT